MALLRPSVDLRDEIVVDDHSHPILDGSITDRHFHPFQHDHTRLTPLELLRCFSLGGLVPDFLRTHDHTVTRRELDGLERSASSRSDERDTGPGDARAGVRGSLVAVSR